jgi:hypothetical protein
LKRFKGDDRFILLLFLFVLNGSRMDACSQYNSRSMRRVTAKAFLVNKVFGETTRAGRADGSGLLESPRLPNINHRYLVWPSMSFSR